MSFLNTLAENGPRAYRPTIAPLSPTLGANSCENRVVDAFLLFVNTSQHALPLTYALRPNMHIKNLVRAKDV